MCWKICIFHACQVLVKDNTLQAVLIKLFSILCPNDIVEITKTAWIG